MPTVWVYVRSLGGTSSFMGLVVSLYSIPAMILSPVLGTLSDKFRRVKVILVICHLARISGNALYSIPVSKYYLLTGRFLSGVSAAGDGVLYGEVARVTDAGKERAKTFLVMDGIWTLGASFGPVLASIWTFHIDIFGWKINEGNFPGFVMTIIWIVILIFTFFLPSNFKKENEHEDENTSNSDNKDDHDDATSEKRNPAKHSSLDYYSKVPCLFYIIFLACFLTNVVCLYTPLLAMELFHLEQLHVKLLFANGTLCLIVVYLTLYITAEYFEEGSQLLFTISLQIVPILVLFILALCWNSGLQELSYLLVIYICFGMSYSSFPLGCSLLSKITNPDHASFYQGLSTFTFHGGCLAGRIIPSLFLGKATMIYFSLGLGFLWAFGICWLCFVYQGFKPKKP